MNFHLLLGSSESFFSESVKIDPLLPVYTRQREYPPGIILMGFADK